MLVAIERVLGMLNGATVLSIELLHFSELASAGATPAARSRLRSRSCRRRSQPASARGGSAAVPRIEGTRTAARRHEARCALTSTTPRRSGSHSSAGTWAPTPSLEEAGSPHPSQDAR